MPQKVKVATAARSMAAGLAGLMVLAGPAGAQSPRSPDIAPQAQAKVEVRLSVRPMVRLASAPLRGPGLSGTPSVCLWSNFDPGQYALRGEWSDGRSAELVPPGKSAAGSCGTRGMMLDAAGIAGTSRGEENRLVMLVIEGR